MAAQQGIITVTLTWGAELDVDLHVFEPNGTHVYYASRIGFSGFLDVDDVTGFGPEHYFVQCSTLETGTYHVGVNYFRGFGPEIALVQIQSGLLVRTFSIDLDEPVGFFGNDTPVPVADIMVAGNRIDGFSFEIQCIFAASCCIVCERRLFLFWFLLLMLVELLIPVF